MKNILIIATIGLIGMIALGSATASDGLMSWLASASVEYQVVRVVIIGLLVGLLVSNPPRRLWFRAVLASAGVILGVSSFVLAINYHMNLLDMIVFIEIALIFLIEALEDAKVPTTPKHARLT